MTATLSTCPSFIDLRPLAAAARPSADPFGKGRTLLPLREAPVEVGAIALEAGAGATPPLSGDWWLIAEAGTVTLAGAGGTVMLSGAQSCVVRDGTALAWSAPAGAALVFMRYTGGTGGPGLVPIDPAAELAPSNPPLADLLVGETPFCRNNTMHRSADGTFTCGVWDSTPYHRRAMRYAHFELMYLLEGAVTFVDETAQTRTFRAGELFLVEQGASCSWDSREHVAKIFAIYRPA